MENITLVFIVLPLIVGGAVLVGAWLLTRIMPGEGKAVAATAEAAAARGPRYEELATERKKGKRVGMIMLAILAVLTVAEITVALALNSVALLLIVNILEAAAIMVVFMHIKTVWSSKETH